MIVPLPHQVDHIQNVIKGLETYDSVIDCSITGSGKTYTSIAIANHFIDNDDIAEVWVVCPPILIPMWEGMRHLLSTRVEKFVVQSPFAMKKLFNESNKVFLIVDEFHMFKNSNQMHSRLKRYICRSKKNLLCSATPLDDGRQVINLEGLVFYTPDIVFSMDFCYQFSQRFVKTFVFLTVDELGMYEKGLLYTACSYDITTNVFDPKLYGCGMKNLKRGLLEGLIREIGRVMTIPNRKIVVVCHFHYTFESIMKEYPNSLVINGKTSPQDRQRNIAKFQENNLNHRLILLSEQVGGVGISLDDRTGDYPRELIIVPTINGINFIQACGRVLRSTTRSDSKVRVIQPIYRRPSFFRRTIEPKINFISSITKRQDIFFSTSIQEHRCGFHDDIINLLPILLVGTIRDYTCNCLLH